MAILLGGGGVTLESSVVTGKVYDPVYDTPMDAEFIYRTLPSFYRDLMEDKNVFSTLWSGILRDMSASMLNLWQIDYAKSLTTVPVHAQRKWRNIDLYKILDMLTDPALTSVGIPGIFSYDDTTSSVVASTQNRARSDRFITLLPGVVDEQTSLAWEVEVSVIASEPFGATLFGYYSSLSDRLAGSISVGVLADASGQPNPFILHTDVAGNGTGSVGAYALSLDHPYRLDAEYTASVGVLTLTTTDLRYVKVSGSLGHTSNDLASVSTNIFRDVSVNFDSLGVVAGDFLITMGVEYQILSVTGSQLTVSPMGLPVDTSNDVYSVEGPHVVSTIALNIRADASDPLFTSDQFGVASLDTGAMSSTFMSNLPAARRKGMTCATSGWRYLDPTLADAILSIPRLQSNIIASPVILHEGTDFSISRGGTQSSASTTIRFREAPKQSMWAEYVAYDEFYLRDNFGDNIGISDFSSDAYKAKIQGLYYAYFQGPTLEAMQVGTYILLGLPISAKAGTVTSINTAYSGTHGKISVGVDSYLYPLSAGTTLLVGDTVRRFQPLSEGSQVVDYISDPSWYTSLASFNEMQKFHSFQVQMNLDVLDLVDFQLAKDFVNKLKPSWTQGYFQGFKVATDSVAVSDALVLDLSLGLYDTFCPTLPLVAYDDALYAAPTPDWSYDQGTVPWSTVTPSMTQQGKLLSGSIVLSGGSQNVVGASTTFLSDIGGAGIVLDRSLALAVHRSSSTGDATEGSRILTDVAANFLEADRPVSVGDVVEIQGYGSFTIISVDSPTQISLGRVLPVNLAGVAYTITGDFYTWATVYDVTDDLACSFVTASPANVYGEHKAILINNAYLTAGYSNFEEVCPDEGLTFTLIISATYGGTFPRVVILPDSRTTSISQSITAPLGSTGDRVSSVLAEPVV